MKYAVLFGVCLAFVLVVESFGQEMECDKDCGDDGCCRMVFYVPTCYKQKGEGQPCRTRPLPAFCHQGCKAGLVCQPGPGDKPYRGTCVQL
ncbi:hypothetical protein OS493_027494 [Desmophyllum pertusum]|uniref:Uncharacterized protein n=1 Tax=Desmophyllum pertusum TaxID=174260 RepID=A0A9X0CDK8_9CNID|nr:hypothetical protein OS493_027494 [Desmophyllum pertusum]